MPKINQFIRQSKAVWNYSESFLNVFMEKYGVKPSFLEREEIVLFEKDQSLVGLYAFKINEQSAAELDLFFINSNHIRQGLGKQIWQHAINFASTKGWLKFELVSDPNAEGFYLKMGAKSLRKFESFPGRFVPVLSVSLV
ncbi:MULTISPECIES: GNAT family N-acetyltransferase [Legionella]|uniref:GNAT family N-acetyltransferase n=1 Tax=Legionella TaxID=445 RepID=UPI00138F7DCE|nr:MULTISPECIES: GNAT family N-acetyltransferase [Legionella]